MTNDDLDLSGIPDPFTDDELPASPALAAALEAQDSAAVAFELRNGVVVVPLLLVEGPAQVRVFRAPGSETSTVLLFSSAEAYIRMLPGEPEHRVLTYRRDELVEFLEKHRESIGDIWFDLAGPHPMQADPDALVAALRL